MKTLKCPHCGSKDVLMWQEENITYYYKVKKNGERYKWPSYSYNSSSSMPYGYRCDNCGEYGYSYDLEEWEQENDKMKKPILTNIGFNPVAPQPAAKQCYVETTTDGKTIVVTYGETTNAEVKIYNPIYLLTEEKGNEKNKGNKPNNNTSL